MELLDYLKVYEFENKIRLGNNYDGGYVIANLNNNIYDCYISAGVSNDESFSRDFINKFNMNKNNSFAFDGTIKNYPYKYTKKITFIKKNIGYYRNLKEANLQYFIEKYNNIFLKMDIEGGEYSWLNFMDELKLLKFKQIVIEFHCINNEIKDKITYFDKLSKTHYLVHAHGNNCSGITNKIPDVIELTYVRKDIFENEPKLNTIPLPIKNLDYQNWGGVPDIDLNFPPFTN